MRKPFDGQFEQTQNWNDPRYRSSYFQFGLLGHNGEDYACPVWTPILTPHAGTIKEATFDPGYGNYVKVESDTEGSILAHLAKISIGVGEFVQEGTLIGYSGNTGNSTGAHLHWGYYRTKTRDRTNGFAGFIDQTDWLDHAITAQPIAQTDQTIIDLGQYGKMEVQAIRGKMGDLEIAQKQISELQEQVRLLKLSNETLTKQYRDCVGTTVTYTAPNSASTSTVDETVLPPNKTITLPPFLSQLGGWFKNKLGL